MVTKSKEIVRKPSNGNVTGRQARVTAAPGINGNGSSQSDRDTLRKLYSSLLRCRLVGERLRESSASNEFAANCDVRIGCEAIAIGATADLRAEDTITASPRNLAVLLARGVPVKTLMAATTADDLTAAEQRLAFPSDPFNLGTGIALAHRLEQKHHIVVAFCAQEKPPLEDWHDALKFAAAHKLPIVFVIENGMAGDSEGAPHLEALSFMARDYGFPGIVVDGNDVVAVWRVAQESIHRARIGSGPTLIDCRTDALRDPLAHMEHYLRQRNAWDDAWKREIELQIARELEDTENLAMA